MRIVTLAGQPTAEIDRFGSRGVRIAPLGHGELSVHVASIDAGGRLGRHPAVGPQLLTPVTGSAEVAGTDGVFQPLVPGQAVVWASGERHETRSDTGASVIIIEGADLAV